MNWVPHGGRAHCACDGNNEAILYVDDNTIKPKWVLGLKFKPRITTDVYDATILWPVKFTPELADAMSKSDEILKKEWRKQ